MAHGDVREGKWRGNWRTEWLASNLHTTSELGVSSITSADAYSSAASSRLNWRSRRFKWTPPFRRKTKSCFCACAIRFQTRSTARYVRNQISFLRAPCYPSIKIGVCNGFNVLMCSVSTNHLIIPTLAVILKHAKRLYTDFCFNTCYCRVIYSISVIYAAWL